MKKVAFIGGYDKSDLIIYISRILTVLKNKVLFIDTTLIAKSQYIVPTMTPTQKYITTFDGIDVAIGFENMQDIKNYIGISGNLDYDYVLVDIDNPEKYAGFEFSPEDMHFFVTSFDVYSVQKGVNVLKSIKAPTEMTKILFTRNPESEENEYLDFVTFNFKCKWKEDIIYFPFETNDLYAIFQNQRFSKVRLMGLSGMYIDGLAFIVETITGLSKGNVKKAIKLIDRT